MLKDAGMYKTIQGKQTELDVGRGKSYLCFLMLLMKEETI